MSVGGRGHRESRVAYRRRGRSTPGQRGIGGLLGVALALAPAVVAVTPPAAAAPSLPGAAQPRRQSLQGVLDDLVSAGAPGALAQVRSQGPPQSYSSGVADLLTRQRPRADMHIRIGSVTKTFVATVILQLVAEGRLRLTDTLGELLPGVVTDNDGSGITVRMLLNHTSGLYNYTEDPAFQRLFYRNPLLYFTADDLVHIATSHPSYFAPGTSWHYSNTNYVLLGMIIDRVTAHSYAAEITTRIIRPLGLRNTSLPGHNPDMPPPYMSGYTRSPVPPRQIENRTRFDAYGADGEIISTTGELNLFMSALLAGRLLPQSLLRTMLAPTVVGGVSVPYGLGVSIVTLPCGVTVYGHNGEVFGSQTTVRGTLGGRRTVAVNHNDDYVGSAPFYEAAYETVFCPTSGPGTGTGVG